MKQTFTIVLFVFTTVVAYETSEGSLFQLVDDIRSAMPARDSYGFTKPNTAEQNYLIPFQPSTKIKYFIPSNSFVTLTVYNIVGNKVLILVNEDQTSGEYSVELNAVKSGNKNISGCDYIYKLSVDTKSISKKI